MANRWGIPRQLENEIRQRDADCIYCRRPFGTGDAPIATGPSWEHIINDASLISFDNIALCCRGCNASKGQKTLQEWLGSPYCKKRNISASTIANIAKNALLLD